jgi:hypothetical protein
MRGPDDVDAHPQGASPFGVYDLVGNIWRSPLRELKLRNQIASAPNLHGAREPTLHRICVHQARLLELKITASEYGKVRDTSDVVTRCKFGELFSVDL